MPASHPELIVPPVPVRPLAPAVVLDTNVLLDWFVFHNPAVLPITQALLCGQLRWCASPGMRLEFQHMLSHDSLGKWQPNKKHALTFFDAWCQIHPEPPPSHLRCTDPDDQVFADLAVACGARWLFTHDRALLKLRRRLADKGVTVMPPSAWPGLMFT